jgi:Methyltransferase domain/C-methyltransferase C-terminal domain/Putative zinc binding domain
MVGTERKGSRCKLCNSLLDGPQLDLGNLPACNRFTTERAALQTHPLIMAACGTCGLAQLAVYPGADFVVPRVPWIRYREPDAHLDDLAERLFPLLSGRQAKSIGVGPFDAPLLDRLGRKGVASVPLNLMGTLATGHHAPGTYPYLETLQGLLRPAELAAIAAAGTGADVVVCRYLLEHSHDPLATLAGLKHLIGPDGALVIEVPDSEKFLSRADYSFVWEEHICYFSKSTIARLAIQAGYQVSHFFRYDGVLEDALVIVLENSAGGTQGGIDDDGRNAAELFSVYQADFPKVRAAWQSKLDAIVRSGRKIGLLGVGHQAIMFLNALGLQEYISLVADDEPDKLSSFAPGIASPIVSSAAMANDSKIGVWLLAVSPRAHPAITRKFADVLARGIQMYSIFAESRNETMAEVTL